MTTKELAVLLKVPENRINVFKVKLTRMKYDENVLQLGTDYEMIRGVVDYKDSAIPKIKDRISKLFKRPKRVYVLDGEHRRVK